MEQVNQSSSIDVAVLKTQAPFNCLDENTFQALVGQSGISGLASSYGSEQQERASSLKWVKRYHWIRVPLVSLELAGCVALIVGVVKGSKPWMWAGSSSFLFGVLSQLAGYQEQKHHRFVSEGIPDDLDNATLSTLANRQCDLAKLAKQGLLPLKKLQTAALLRTTEKAWVTEARQQVQAWGAQWETELPPEAGAVIALAE